VKKALTFGQFVIIKSALEGP